MTTLLALSFLKNGNMLHHRAHRGYRVIAAWRRGWGDGPMGITARLMVYDAELKIFGHRYR